MGEDKGKQQTKVGEMREIINDLYGLSIDLRDKAINLTSSPKAAKEPGKDIEAPTENVGNELVGRLRNIRGILQEALKTFSAFV